MALIRHEVLRNGVDRMRCDTRWSCFDAKGQEMDLNGSATDERWADETGPAEEERWAEEPGPAGEQKSIALEKRSWAPQGRCFEQ